MYFTPKLYSALPLIFSAKDLHKPLPTVTMEDGLLCYKLTILYEEPLKFLVIIAVAVSLEALVFVFDAAKENIANLIYPTFLLIAAVFVVVGLGIYQKLTGSGDR